MDSDFSQHLLTRHNLALAHIARGAPLAHTLNIIINGVVKENSGLILSLFAMEEADSLRLLSASNLPLRYSNAIAEIIAAGIVQFSDENLEESEFLSSLRSAAPELGLHATATIPFPFTTHGMSGFFILHSPLWSAPPPILRRCDHFRRSCIRASS